MTNAIDSFTPIPNSACKQMAVSGDNPFLPPEIIIDILKRLPVKSLVRLRTVCKDWKNLFKTQYFIAEHYQHSAHKNPLLIFHKFGHNPRHSPICLLRYKMESVEVERIPAMDSLRHVCRFAGSCNGLLCVILGYDDDSSQHALLLNPATREVREVPRTTINNWGFAIFGWGFGFSPVVMDYKIVRIHKCYSDNLDNIYVDEVEVYSLRTGSWKEVEFGAIQSVIFQSNPVTVNGVIFWLGLETVDYRGVIVSFDIAMEVFTLIPLPSSNSDPIALLDVYDNKVALLCRPYALESAFFHLWVLEEGSGAYGRSWVWTKKYSIGPISGFLDPICFWRNEIVCQDMKCERNLFILTTNNELKKIYVSSYIGRMHGVSNHEESLVSMRDMHVE